MEADCVTSECDAVIVLEVVVDRVNVGGGVDEWVEENVVVPSEIVGLGEALPVWGGDMVKVSVAVGELLLLAVGIGVVVTDAEGDVD